MARASWPIDLVASVMHLLALSPPEGFTLRLNVQQPLAFSLTYHKANKLLN